MVRESKMWLMFSVYPFQIGPFIQRIMGGSIVGARGNCPRALALPPPCCPPVVSIRILQCSSLLSYLSPSSTLAFDFESDMFALPCICHCQFVAMHCLYFRIRKQKLRQ